MGAQASTTKASTPGIITVTHSPTTPDFLGGELQFDPHYGFEGKQRKERVMIATQAEMESANVPLKYRDFCAHKFIYFEKCKKENAPLFYRCQGVKHEYMQCQYDEYIIRMKEYERERRLLERRERKAKKAALLAGRAEIESH